MQSVSSKQDISIHTTHTLMTCGQGVVKSVVKKLHYTCQSALSTCVPGQAT